MSIETELPENAFPTTGRSRLRRFSKRGSNTRADVYALLDAAPFACAFNLEYLLTGGQDGRTPEKPIFMFFDWLPGGWGGRNGKDGSNVTTACFGTGLMSQPVEAQERANPILTTECEILTDSAGPG